MLPLLELDNEKFENIVKDAIKMIPGYTSEWTDFNHHDPGIMTIQLFAWLKEMQQFYLDGIGEAHRIRYLKLLGIEPGHRCPATAVVNIQAVRGESLYLPAGMRLAAKDVIFETQQAGLLMHNPLRGVYVDVEKERIDFSSILEKKSGGLCPVFGLQPQAGNCLYLGYEQPWPVGEAISLYVDVFSKEALVRNPIDLSVFCPLASVSWEIWNGSQWVAVKLLEDQTHAFIQSGVIRFELETPMAKLPLEDDRGDAYFIRATLMESHYDVVPRIEGLWLNTVSVVQQKTLSEYCYFDGTGEGIQTLILDRYLGLAGNCEVQIADGHGAWRTWYKESQGHAEGFGTSEIQGRSLTEKMTKVLTLRGNHAGEVIPKGHKNIRIICQDKYFEHKSNLGSSNGYPEQEFEIGLNNVIQSSLRIQVGEEDETGRLWRDWTVVDDLLGMHADMQVFSFDEREGRIRFGDGEHGWIPEIGRQNLRIMACVETLGEDGNIHAGEISSLSVEELPIDVDFPLWVENRKHAIGGKHGETVEEAILRFRIGLQQISRAVTASDYATLAKNTPGLMIEKVKALPGYSFGHGRTLEPNQPNAVALVVKPYTEVPTEEILNRAYYENLYRHLDRHRLVTTEVSIVPPRYFGIDVYCILVIKPYFREVDKLIRDFLSVELDGQRGARDFGQAVLYGELFGKLKSLACVERVVSLSIETREVGATKNPGGDILIPPYALTFLKNLDFELKEQSLWGDMR